MSKSEKYPPTSADGIAANQGTTLYTGPCKNRQVGGK